LPPPPYHIRKEEVETREGKGLEDGRKGVTFMDYFGKRKVQKTRREKKEKKRTTPASKQARTPEMKFAKLQCILLNLYVLL